MIVATVKQGSKPSQAHDIDTSALLCRICCNPHIYTFCIIDGALKKSSVEAFAESMGVTIGDSRAAAEPSQQLRRCCCSPDVS